MKRIFNFIKECLKEYVNIYANLYNGGYYNIKH